MAKQRKITRSKMPKSPRFSGPRTFHLFAQRHRDRFRKYVARVRGFSDR